jgi:hypothetical protein
VTSQSPDPIIERIVLFLVPFFVGVSDDSAAVRRAILDSLDEFGTTNHADLLIAAQVIAFGFAALDTLAEAHAGNHPEATRVRLRACANTLHRSVRMCEDALAKRPGTKVPKPPSRNAGAQTGDAIEQARAFAASVRARLPAARQAPEPAGRDRIWANALREVAGELQDDPVPT